MKVVVITQARTGSTRLPNKVLKEINGQSLLEIHLKRIKKSKLINEIIVATTVNERDDIIESISSRLDVFCFRGSENDVLDRFYQAVKNRNVEYVVRLTSDCPLIDPNVIDRVVSEAIKSKVAYCSNTLIESFPDGQDVEVFTFKSLEKAWMEATLNSDREHVTPYIKKNSSFNGGHEFKALNIESDFLKFRDVRLTVDEENDFKVVEILIQNLGLDVSYMDYSEFYLNNENILLLNNHITRNEGYLKSVKNDN